MNNEPPILIWCEVSNADMTSKNRRAPCWFNKDSLCVEGIPVRHKPLVGWQTDAPPSRLAPRGFTLRVSIVDALILSVKETDSASAKRVGAYW